MALPQSVDAEGMEAARTSILRGVQDAQATQQDAQRVLATLQESWQSSSAGPAFHEAMQKWQSNAAAIQSALERMGSTMGLTRDAVEQAEQQGGSYANALAMPL